MLIIQAATYRSLRWTPPFPVALTLEVLRVGQYMGVVNPNQESELFRVNLYGFHINVVL